MNPYDNNSRRGAGAGLAALCLAALAGAAAYLLSTEQGRKLMAQAESRADEWQTRAAAAVAESREKVVSSVESQSPPPPDDPGGAHIRERL